MPWHSTTWIWFRYYACLECTMRKTWIKRICQIAFTLTKGAITKAIKKLESNGIIIRQQSKVDKRHNILKLSQKGKDLIPILEEINNEWEEKMGLDKLDDEFFKTFIDLAFKSAELNDWEWINYFNFFCNNYSQ